MSYIQKNLLPGETVIYRAELHWIIFVGPLLIIGVGFVLSFLPSEPETNWGSIALALGLFLLANSALTKWTSEFAVTDRRIIAKVGFVRRTSLETLMSRVEGIEVHQDIPGRILGYGTIIVRGVGGGTKPIRFISQPMALRSHVYAQIEATGA
ncbi:MAG: PH domain-containing protein [Alphaproteobacteria bacterium]